MTDEPTVQSSAASIISANNIHDFGTTVPGYAITSTLNIKAVGLTSDISINIADSTSFTTTVAKVDSDIAMSADGYNLPLTFNPSRTGEHTTTVTLTSDGASPLVFKLSGHCEPCTDVTLANKIINLTSGDGTIYRYTGNAIVTYVDTTNTVIYAQDNLGGLALRYSDKTPTSVRIGDKITNVVGFLELNQGVPFLFNFLPPVVVSHDNDKQPADISLEALQSVPEQYLHTLVRVADLTIEGSGDTFDSHATLVTDGTTNGLVQPFACTDVIGSERPAIATITGIMRYLDSPAISPRSLADITPTPKFAVISLYKHDSEPIAINTPTVVRRYELGGSYLNGATSIYINGAASELYRVTPEIVEETSPKTEVTVTYTPTAIGKYTARVNFDVNPAKLSCSEAMTYYAYDPANPPTITLANEPTQFVAKPGGSVTQRLAVNTSNLVDYGAVTVGNESEGAFSINNTTLMKNGTTTMIISFKPTVTGEYTESVTLTSPKAESVQLTLYGKCVDDSGVEDITADADGTYHVYNMQGIKLLTTSNVEHLKLLPAGLYIVNGKKMAVEQPLSN